MLGLTKPANFPTPMSMLAFSLPDGDAGTEATICAMRRLIDEGKKDPVIHELAAKILKRDRVAAFDWLGEVRAIYDSVRRNVRFTRDIRGKETLHAAREIVRLGIGDCDDFTVLLCCLLETIGCRTRIVTIAGDGRAPDVFTHVFPEVKVGQQWIPVDAARRDPKFGRAPKNTYRVRIWDTTSDEFEDIQGLSGISTLSTPAKLPRAWRPGIPAWQRQLSGVSCCNGRRRLGAYAGTYGPPRGAGNYGYRALSRLGQDGSDEGFDWSSLPSLISAATTGTANIITAERAAPINLRPYTGGPSAPVYAPAPASSGIGGISTTTLMIGGIGLVAVIALSRGK
jgi:hypothetical protein